MHIEFTNNGRLGDTVRELEEVWVKIENYHREMVLKRKREKRGDKSERQIYEDMYRGIASCTNARWETSGVIAATQKTNATWVRVKKMSCCCENTMLAWVNKSAACETMLLLLLLAQAGKASAAAPCCISGTTLLDTTSLLWESREGRENDQSSWNCSARNYNGRHLERGGSLYTFKGWC